MIRKILFVLLILFAISGIALAKVDPYMEALEREGDWGGLDNPAAIWSPTAAAAHVGTLGEYGDVDAFTVEFAEGSQTFQFALSVPVCGEHFKDFFPSAAIIGPGLDTPAEGALPFTLANGDGALIFQEGKLDADAIRRIFSNNDVTGEPVYADTLRNVDIPEAGMYTLAIWEPDGNVGAYMLTTGTEHDQFQQRPDAELEAAFDMLFSQEWMGQDCNAPLAAVSCPATGGIAGDAQIPDGPEQNDVGDGFVLTGIVRDSSTCLPLANAQIAFWMTNAEGEYDGVGEGVLYTNAQGRYRLESNVPGQYDDVTPHIHLAISAPGYAISVTEFLFEREGIESGEVDVNLQPES
jgi:hypothetical protein